MNNQSYNLVTLEWLLPVLNDEMNSIHEVWRSSHQTDFAFFEDAFTKIGNVLFVANLKTFANLAYALKSSCQLLAQDEMKKALAPKIFYASRLLQYEINRHIFSKQSTQSLVDLRLSYIDWLFKDQEEVDLSAIGHQLFSGQIPKSDEVAVSLNDEDYKKLTYAWRHQVQNLLSQNQNGDELLVLTKIAEHLKNATDNHALKSLWHISEILFENLYQNDEPVPVYYVHLLSELDKFIGSQTQDFQENVKATLWLENTLVDIYIELAKLETVDNGAKILLNNLNHNLNQASLFFPYALSSIESMLFAMARNKPIIKPLAQLKAQFAERGWSFYEMYTEQIIQDVNTASQDEYAFVSMNWQITTQLQDLYGAILSTHDAIESKIGEVDETHTQNKDDHQVKNLRQIRIWIEDIKTAFSGYLHSKDSNELPDGEVFEDLNQTFDEMGMPKLGQITTLLSELFEHLHQQDPSDIGWVFANTVADNLSRLELFLDMLAKDVFDEAILTQVTEGFVRAKDLIGITDDVSGQAVVNLDVVRYDDSGEILPQEEPDDDHAANIGDEFDDFYANQDAVDNVDENVAHLDDTDNKSVSQPLSEAYLAAKEALKPDVFDFDEDICEIFVEEAEEVLGGLGELLPKWQANPSNLEPLKDIRRGFHTLKGSGRMVGAYSVGELAWAVENMLNRVLDGTVEASDGIADFVVETAGIIPTLVQDFDNKNTPSVDPAITVLKAQNILKGRDINEGIHATTGEILDKSLGDDEGLSSEQTPNQKLSQAPSHQEMVNEDDKTPDYPDVLLPFLQEAAKPLVSTVADIDDDIKEIYIEEAGEVLEEITPLFQQCKNIPDNKEILTDIRRGFHTLKGSGRIVGAVELGELAWSVENLLNRVLDGTVNITDGMMALIDDVLGGFSDLVSLFENNAKIYPSELTLWTAVAHAYSKGLGDKFDYRYLHDQSDDDAKDAPLVDEEENELCEIFIEEAGELLATIEDYINIQDEHAQVVVSDEIVRAFHTLRGASGLAPLVPIGEMAAIIETALQNLQKHDTPMQSHHIDALSAVVSYIKAYIKEYQTHRFTGQQRHLSSDDRANIELILNQAHEPTSKNTLDVSNLFNDIDDLLDVDLTLERMTNAAQEQVQQYAQTILGDIEVLSKKTQESSKFTKVLNALKGAYTLLNKYPEYIKDDDFAEKLLAVQSELTGLFDSLAGSMSLRLNNDVLQALSEKVTEIFSYYEAVDNNSSGDKNKADKAEFEPVDADPDLLEIFLEEATDLDLAIGQAFGAWRDNTDNTDTLKELQRYLHTVKGGARLVGIASIGDLTHEAETVYERFVDGRLAVSDHWVKIMQGVQDILSLQIEEVKQNGRSFYAKDAITKLQDFLAKGKVSEGQAINAPVLHADEVKPAVVEAVPETPKEEADISDFAHTQLQSWKGELPDKDILAVFLEEAEELVESSTEEFQAFRNNTGDVATLQSLQRKLHTIKGGARMVGANGIADLAHHMETVYEDLGSRRCPATRMVIQLLLACHDWLTVAMTLLKSLLNPPTPTKFIEALEGFSRHPDSLTELPSESLAEELEAIAAHEACEKQRRGGRDISSMPPSSGLLVGDEDSANAGEMIRISSNLMERMINLSGEAAINRARIDMSMASLTASIEEMGATIQRLSDQLRRMDIELEAQILAQIDDKSLFDYEGFDPLEMDQYSSLNQLSKSLSESASDLLDLKATLLEKTRDGENLLLQLSRTQDELQDGLMYSRMVPFSRLIPRLQRIVRQVSGELGKNVDLNVINTDNEMDRTILERITSPLEHMLRNAIDHGVEMPEEREAQGKSAMGRISLEVVREGGEILIHLSDDGAGINVEAVRKKAIAQGLISQNDTSLSDLEIMQYIFNAGLSTTSTVTQISGRGVGMDVVQSEIRQLSGSVSVESVRGQGSRFTMRVPLTVAFSDTLVVRVADRQYAVPLVQIERISQVAVPALMEYYQSNNSTIVIDDEEYRLRYLNEILSGQDFSELSSANHGTLPIIIIKNQTGQNIALQVDEIVGSRIEVVVKPLGRQLAQVSGISAATIMGDGSVMFILDLMALIRNAKARVVSKVKVVKSNKRPVVLVVDDSVTVRKVTSRFLERQGFEAVVAKDGMDALEILQDLTPDLMLLDIEMPRMDGFEVATQVRHNERLQELPIIMITSRTGEKHRERAFEIGVTDYMGKPFQENELLSRIDEHLKR